MRRTTKTIPMAVFLTLMGPTSFVMGEASFRGLGDLEGDGFQSEAWGVSADGSVVVGTSLSGSGYQAFRWTQATGMVGLSYLPDGGPSYAYDVSGDGSTVVGWSAEREAFRWTQADGMVSLGDLTTDALYSEGLGVSADGSVVVGRGTMVSPYPHAFRWTSDTGMVGIPLLGKARDVSPNGSVIVGGAYRWTADTGSVFLGQGVGEAWGVSADGSAVVGDGNFGQGSEAFYWTAANGVVPLGDLPGGSFVSRAYAVSSAGIVVGDSSVAPGISNVAAFIWDADHGIRSLQEVLITDFSLDLTGWWLTSATKITDDGLTIVGTGVNPDGKGEAWIARIPEPATLSLLALAGLLVTGHRRGNSPQ